MSVLRALRSRLGFAADDVATAAGWTTSRLYALEAEDDIDEEEAETLTCLYGIDVPAALEGGPDQALGRFPVAALLKGQAEDLPAVTRFAIAEAVTVARSIRHLQHVLDLPTGWDRVEQFAANNDYSHPRLHTPERLAEQVRKAFRLGDAPIVSVREQLFDPLGVLVLWEDLPNVVDAFCFATPETGAVVVANRASDHVTSAFGRRITWAHELCHILFDRPKMREMRRFCAVSYDRRRRYDSGDDEEAIERRARAFAVWLLAPRTATTSVWKASADLSTVERVRHIMATFGLGYNASRSHLQDVSRLRMSEVIPPVNASVPARWEGAEPAVPLNSAALEAGVSPLRAGALLDHLKMALSAGRVSEEYVRGAVRVDLHAWQELRAKLGLPVQGTWRSSSALTVPMA